MTASGDVADYAQLPLGCFLDMVASREPAPGGGASAAVAVALAAALSGMAARLSADYLIDANGLAERAECLRQRVAPLAQEDATAYRHVLAAYRVPHGEGPGIRRERIQKALSDAADVPLNIAEAGPRLAGSRPDWRGRETRTCGATRWRPLFWPRLGCALPRCSWRSTRRREGDRRRSPQARGRVRYEGRRGHARDRGGGRTVICGS